MGLSKLFNTLTVLFLLLTGICAVLSYNSSLGIFLTLAITFGTFAYHLTIRLFVAFLVNFAHHEFDARSRWFEVGKRETALYNKLGVKCWKSKLPTYMPESFNPKVNSWQVILQEMCKSEVVHELNVVLSFLPIFAGRWFGAYPVFIITSVLAATFDLLFVIIQRYNRPRVISLLERQKGRNDS